MFDEMCRRLYWWFWRLMPSEDELLEHLTPEQRARLDDMKRLLGVQHG